MKILSTNGIIRSRKSEKDTQYNGKTKMDKKNKKNKDLQSSTSKTKNCSTQTPPKKGEEFVCSKMVGSSCFISDTRRVIDCWSHLFYCYDVMHQHSNGLLSYISLKTLIRKLLPSLESSYQCVETHYFPKRAANSWKRRSNFCDKRCFNLLH